MKKIIAIITIFSISFALHAEEKKSAALAPLATMGDLDEIQKRIVFNRLQESLSKFYKLTSQKMYEKAEEEAFQQIDADECTEDQCIAIIQELLQVEEFFNLEILKTNNYSQMKLTKIDLDSNRIVRTIAFNNCGFEEITDSVEGLVESIEDDESLDKIECEARSRNYSNNSYSSKKSTFNLENPIAVRFGFLYGTMLSLDYAYDEKKSFGIFQFDFDFTQYGLRQIVSLSGVYMLYGMKFSDNMLIMPIYGTGNNSGKTEYGSEWDLDISVIGVEVGYNFTFTDSNNVSVMPLFGYNIASVTQENKWNIYYSDEYYDTLEYNFRNGYTNFLIAVLIGYTFK